MDATSSATVFMWLATAMLNQWGLMHEQVTVDV